jgi:tRNA uridine 5-carboxymethylaminomethyl modification enzyme
MEKVLSKQHQVERVKKVLFDMSIDPADINPFFTEIGSATITEKYKAAKLLLRPNVSLQQMTGAVPPLAEALQPFDYESIEQAEIQVKYETYIVKEKELVQKMAQLEDLVIPDVFDYSRVNALSNEARAKFLKIRPRTLGQASRISGVNPSDVQILMVFMGR